MIIEFKKSLRNKLRKDIFLFIDERICGRNPKGINYIDHSGRVMGLIWNSFSNLTYDNSFNHDRLQI